MISPRSSSDPAGADPTRGTWRLREASGRDDACYLVRQWHHYFGAEYCANWLPYGPYRIAGWDTEGDEEDESVREDYGMIATHESCTETAACIDVGGGFVELFDRDAIVDQLPDGRFDRAALASDRNAWLWFGVVNPPWRGRRIGHVLFRARLEWAIEQGADESAIVRTVRARPGPALRGLLSRLSRRLSGLWVWPSDDENRRCAATLWARELPIDPLLGNERKHSLRSVIET